MLLPINRPLTSQTNILHRLDYIEQFIITRRDSNMPLTWNDCAAQANKFMYTFKDGLKCQHTMSHVRDRWDFTECDPRCSDEDLLTSVGILRCDSHPAFYLYSTRLVMNGYQYGQAACMTAVFRRARWGPRVKINWFCPFIYCERLCCIQGK